MFEVFFITQPTYLLDFEKFVRSKRKWTKKIQQWIRDKKRFGLGWDEMTHRRLVFYILLVMTQCHCTAAIFVSFFMSTESAEQTHNHLFCILWARYSNLLHRQTATDHHCTDTMNFTPFFVNYHGESIAMKKMSAVCFYAHLFGESIKIHKRANESIDLNEFCKYSISEYWTKNWRQKTSLLYSSSMAHFYSWVLIFWYNQMEFTQRASAAISFDSSSWRSAVFSVKLYQII